MNSTSVIKWDLENPSDSFMNWFCCQVLKRVYGWMMQKVEIKLKFFHFCILMSLDSIMTSSLNDDIFSFFKYLCKFIKVSNQAIIVAFTIIQNSVPSVGPIGVPNCLSVTSVKPSNSPKTLLSLSPNGTPSLVTSYGLSLNPKWFYQSCPKCCSLWLTPFFLIQYLYSNLHSEENNFKIPDIVYNGLYYKLLIAVPDLPINHPSANLFNCYSLIYGSDKLFLQPPYEIQIDTIVKSYHNFQQIAFVLSGTSSPLIYTHTKDKGVCYFYII